MNSQSRISLLVKRTQTSFSGMNLVYGGCLFVSLVNDQGCHSKTVPWLISMCPLMLKTRFTASFPWLVSRDNWPDAFTRNLKNHLTSHQRPLFTTHFILSVLCHTRCRFRRDFLSDTVIKTASLSCHQMQKHHHECRFSLSQRDFHDLFAFGCKLHEKRIDLKQCAYCLHDTMGLWRRKDTTHYYDDKEGHLSKVDSPDDVILSGHSRLDFIFSPFLVLLFWRWVSRTHVTHSMVITSFDEKRTPQETMKSIWSEEKVSLRVSRP